MSDLLPSELGDTTGPLRCGVIGRIVSLRIRELGDQKGTKGRGKQNKRGGKTNARSVLEVHLCGGDTPAPVVMFEAWDAGVQERLRPVAQIGAAVRIQRCSVMTHTDKSVPWTTSRLRIFLRATEETVMTAIDDHPEWPLFHPITTVQDLNLLPGGTLVCVAGRIVNPPPKIKSVTANGEDLNVGNANLRAQDACIQLSFWRDRAAMVNDLTIGEIYYFRGVAKHNKNMCSDRNVDLRATAVTTIEQCPEPLRTEIANATPEGHAGAQQLSFSSGRRDYTQEEARWYSLSVCAAILHPQMLRSVDTLCQVASVMLQLQDGEPSYPGCSVCKKGWPTDTDAAPCACKDAIRKVYWRCNVTLTDHSAQVPATCFEAFESAVEVFAEGSPTKMEPAYYSDAENRMDLALFLAAFPFTVRLTFSENDYTGRMELIIQSMSPTFDETNGVKHPLKPVIWFEASPAGCPPCKVADTTFNGGVGLTILYGKGISTFRVLLELFDTPKGARRGNNADTVKVTRECVCALRGQDDGTMYTILQNAPLEVATRFLQVGKNAYIHAIVARRSGDSLTLLDFWPVPPSRVTKFRQFFEREVSVYDATVRGQKQLQNTSADETPVRLAAKIRKATQDEGTQGWNDRTGLATP